MKAEDQIEVYGARVHNLKNIDVNIPRNSLTVITGLSGSGKSSLAFDTIFAEGQRRYIETFSAYARNMLGGMDAVTSGEIIVDGVRVSDFKENKKGLATYPTPALNYNIHLKCLADYRKYSIPHHTIRLNLIMQT